MCEINNACVPPAIELKAKYTIRVHGQDIELTEYEAEALFKLLQGKFPPKTTWSVYPYTTTYPPPSNYYGDKCP